MKTEDKHFDNGEGKRKKKRKSGRISFLQFEYNFTDKRENGR